MTNFKKIYNKIKKYSEMTMSECEFLYNTILKYKPKKIVEIGVSSGASSALILDAIKDDKDAMLYSVDLAEYYYKEPQKKVGFLVEKKFSEFKNKYNLYTKGTIADFIETIGSDIDFVLLDSAHGLPGEVLDFLLIYKYCSRNTIIVVHDINIQLNIKTQSTAPKLLINTVIADKFYPQITDYSHGFPNIGAFKLTDETENSIDNLFNILLINWVTIIKQEKLLIIRKILKKNYNNELVNYFDIAVKNNYNNLLTANLNHNKRKIKKKKDSILSKIFSVRNENFNKVIRILGLKISIKNQQKLILNIQEELKNQNNILLHLNKQVQNLSNKLN